MKAKMLMIACMGAMLTLTTGMTNEAKADRWDRIERRAARNYREARRDFRQAQRRWDRRWDNRWDNNARRYYRRGYGYNYGPRYGRGYRSGYGVYGPGFYFRF